MTKNEACISAQTKEVKRRSERLSVQEEVPEVTSPNADTPDTNKV